MGGGLHSQKVTKRRPRTCFWAGYSLISRRRNKRLVSTACAGSGGIPPPPCTLAYVRVPSLTIPTWFFIMEVQMSTFSKPAIAYSAHPADEISSEIVYTSHILHKDFC